MSALIEYCNIVHDHGLGSREARQFIKERETNKLFKKRVQVINRCFLNRTAILAALEEKLA